MYPGGRAPVLGFLGAIGLAVVVPWLPFLQVRYAVEGRTSALFSPRAVRDRFRRAPWAFAFAFVAGVSLLLGYLIGPIAGIALFALIVFGALVWSVRTEEPGLSPLRH